MSRPKKYTDISFKPLKDVAAAAEQELRWRKQFERGGTSAGATRARDLKNREQLILETVRRMVSYFARHEVNKRAADFGNDDDPSARYIAWQLWDGDPGRKWAEAISDKIKQTDDKAQS